jgi:conjugative transposon TraM protein
MPLKQDETYLQSSTDVTSLNTQDPFNGHEGFLSSSEPKSDAQSNAITAMVHGTQTLTSGSTIKLRLLQDIYINGTLIPRNNFVFGNCNLEGDRLNIDIKTIRSERSVFPVSMKAFDMDGLAGIYVPGAISRDAAKEGADQAIQGLDFYSMSPSVGAQAASAGVQAVKGLFSKKVKLIKVTIKSGYSILLGNANLLNQ